MTDLSETNVSKLFISGFYNARNRSSFCWKYFGNLIVVDGNKKKIVNPDHIYCIACLIAVKKESEDITFKSVKIKSYNKTVSTGNLTRHLRDDHQIRPELSDVDKPKSKKKDVKRQIRTASKCDKWALARDLALWFCKSLLPFESISDEGMVDFLQKYNIIITDDDIPSCQEVSDFALTDLYESMLNEVKETICIDGAMHCAISFDIWIDKYRRISYVTFKLHYLTSEFHLKQFTLSTNIITEIKDREKIKDMVEDIMKEFGLEDKNIVAVTNSGKNVIQAVQLANMTHQLCLGHGLHNLVTVDGINSVPEIAELIHKVKKIIKVIRYRAMELHADPEITQQKLEFLSSLDRTFEAIEGDEGDPISELEILEMTELEKNDKSEDGPSSSIIGESKHIPTIKSATPSRWHCVLEMLANVTDFCNRCLINNILRKIGQEELKITQHEWSILKDLVKFLKSFHEAVEIMSSQKTCTMNVALVFRSEIIDVLNNQEYNDPLMLLLKQKMLANINKRFPVSKIMVAAALLDCRFMSLKEVDVFLDKLNLARTSFLSSYIKEVIDAKNMPETAMTNDTHDTSLLHKLSKKHSSGVSWAVQDDPIEQECWRYIAGADPTEPKDGDLLSYWNSKKEVFPRISALAKAVLCVPATSTPSDRVFFIEGLRFTMKRSRLNTMMANKIIFVHDNYKFLRLLPKTSNDP